MDGDWHKSGFVILRKFFDERRVNRVNALVDYLWDSRMTSPLPVTIDINLGNAAASRKLLSSVTTDVRQSSYKLNDLYLDYDEIRQIVLDNELAKIVTQLIGGKALVFNTLNFEYGSEQDDHVDTFYMPPKRANRMLATWTALEKIAPDSGPLRYYPGSHLIPPYLFSHGKTNVIGAELPAFYLYMEQELKKRKIDPVLFTAEPGDVFIWHAQLYHGGSAILDPQQTRRSLVTHYFRTDEYRHLFWRLKKVNEHGYYYKRPHQIPD
ncbi:MAG: phytanoyl-CoA dioxygenase family protein [Gammaproteobacteria bacterium]|nr:phytanoyl-CoA dioxygenase family protein [Gammaproteobacteria bacterium]